MKKILRPNINVFVKEFGCDGNIYKVCTNGLTIGDYVYIRDAGKSYPSYSDAFRFFWGEKEVDRNKLHNKYSLKDDVEWQEVWKIINMVKHPITMTIMCHLRNLNGENVVIGTKGLALAASTKKLFDNIIIQQLPSTSKNIISHEWKEQLFDFYINSEIVENNLHKQFFKL